MSSGVEFDEDKFSFGSPSPAPGPVPSFSGYGQVSGNEPKMVRWLMSKGIVNSPAAAQRLLVIIMIINFIIAFLFIRKIL